MFRVGVPIPIKMNTNSDEREHLILFFFFFKTDFYNTRWRHQGLDRSTSNQVYYGLPRGLPKVA